MLQKLANSKKICSQPCREVSENCYQRQLSKHTCTSQYKKGKAPIVMFCVTNYIVLTCDQALFSFRSVKHSGGKGETKSERHT